ncbi:MAG: cytochrome C [Gallionella sp.]|nr:cytochrome C [Gallionella sp.]
MKPNIKNAVMGLVTPVALFGLLAFNPAQAREPFTKAELADQEQELLVVVDHGRDLWHGSKPSMTTNGLACGNCHPDAAGSNPQTFPKFQADLGRVIPIRDMINWCIQVPQGGQPLDVNGEDMVAMEAYATYMYRGEKIQPGLATKQTAPVVVKSGRGYPWKGSGVGYDK